MKKDQYFNLEVNLLNDDNIAGMMSELDAAEALGIYVMLLLHLRTKDNYEASCTPLLLRAFARRYDLGLDMLEKVLHDYNLFEVDEERQTFRAPYLDRVMQRLEEKWRMDTENGKKGGRPKKRAKCAETPATKGRKPNETQERREEEKIGITPVVNNSSNTLAGGAADAATVVTGIPETAATGNSGAAESSGIKGTSEITVIPETEEKISATGTSRVSEITGDSGSSGSLRASEIMGASGSSRTSRASETSEVRTASSVPVERGMRIRAVDEEGQQPLQPVLSWEALVDRLADSRLYMELAGQRSGLGRLFIDHQQQIIGLFKKHILLYGKEGGLLFFEDVKRYFSNYIAAGSPTCRMLREELMREIKERESKDVSRFESIVDGKRMYLGRLIPDSAPPRPDNSAVWDDAHKRWGH
ncbi:DUF7833 domain-containing protein [Bacteroides difficilis]|uniref:DUF4373 domain-containing protein n=1 Tax=Bacteroides difficilis TaxID=2763021 RepID=A0ABR7CDF4_9BACE|nr:Lin1244/Lin1753 domain-containing protein [Bacteroides difficilis]MBC5605806.1 DUF4373 domain-containing protein [Bacteroides difficilis]